MAVEVTIHTDGGARGNPGPAGTGFTITNPKTGALEGYGGYIGIATNNQAEYRALIESLKKAQEYGAQVVTCYLDSLLVVNQVKGEWKVKEPGLQLRCREAQELARSFQRFSISYIPRAQNAKADMMANMAMDSKSDALNIF